MTPLPEQAVTMPSPACEQAFDDWLASTILPAEAVNSSAVGDVAREAFCSGWDASRDGGETHELVFTDREARPAKWETRCGRTDVPLERAISLPAGYYPVTCKGCIRIAELEQQLEHAKSAGPGSVPRASDHEGMME